MAEASSAPSGVGTTHNVRHYKYYDLVMVGFVTVLLCSNMIGPGKVSYFTLPYALPWIGDRISFGAGNIFFPIGYIFGDILTEVYGYARARKVIWAGFAAMGFAVLMQQVVIHLPPDASEPYNKIIDPAVKTVFDNGWRIAAGSMFAFWVGDFVNSFILAKMKILTSGRFLWSRTIGSTFAGQFVDSILFYPIAFYGLWSTDKLIAVSLFNWAFKLAVEVLFTPITYLVVNLLKRAEKEDYFDRNTDFNPFTLAD